MDTRGTNDIDRCRGEAVEEESPQRGFSVNIL